MNISFTVPGPPVGKARARAGNGHHYTPQKTRDYEMHVKMAAAHAMAGRPMFQGPLQANIMAYLPASKAEQKAIDKGTRVPALKKPDLDNVAKSVLDAMNGVVFRDDSQVTRLIIEKDLLGEPRVEVTVRDYE